MNLPAIDSPAGRRKLAGPLGIGFPVPYRITISVITANEIINTRRITPQIGARVADIQQPNHRGGQWEYPMMMENTFSV